MIDPVKFMWNEGLGLTLIVAILFTGWRQSSAQSTFSQIYQQVDYRHGAIGKHVVPGSSDGAFFVTGTVNWSIQPRQNESSIVTVRDDGTVLSSDLIQDADGVLTASFGESTKCVGDSLFILSEWVVDGLPDSRNLAITTYDYSSEELSVTRLRDTTENFVVGLALDYNPQLEQFRIISWPTDPVLRDGLKRYQVLDREKATVIDRPLPTTEQYVELAIRDVEFLEDGSFLVATFGLCNRDEPGCLYYKRVARLLKYTAEGDHLWTRTYNPVDLHVEAGVRISQLPEGNIALAWTRDTSDRRTAEHPPTIYILDSLGNMRDSIAFHGNIRVLTRMRTAQNGDLLGVGYAWSELGTTGWAFRLTENADLIWERYIKDDRRGDHLYSILYDVGDRPDGSVQLLGTYDMDELPSDPPGAPFAPWLVQLDAEGCFTPGCTSDTILLVDSIVNVVGQPEYVQLTVSPNPVRTTTRIGLPADFASRDAEIQLFDGAGRRVLTRRFTGTEVHLDLGELPAGPYVIRLFVTDGRLLAIRRLVKV